MAINRTSKALTLVLFSLALFALYRVAIHTPSPLMNQAVMSLPESH
jgi:hypothetical protein